MADITFTQDKKDVKTIIDFINKQYLTVGEYLQNILKEKDGAFKPRDYMESQRGYNWEKWRASNLIQTVLLQNPIPEITVYRFDDKSQFRKVLDGQQRLTTLYLFVNNHLILDMSKSIFPAFKIEGEDYSVADLDGKTFSELPELWQDTILNYSVRWTCINNCDDETAERIFVQQNSGAKVLRPAEIRKAAMGSKTRRFFTKSLSNDWVFHALTYSAAMGTQGIEVLGQVITLIDGGFKPVELSKGNVDRVICAYRENGVPAQISSIVEGMNDYLNETTNIVVEKKKIEDENKTGKKVKNYNTYRFPFLNKTHTVMMMVAACIAKESEISEEAFANWLVSFFSNPPKAYKDACGNWTDKVGDQNCVEDRLEAIKVSLDAIK